MFGTIRLAMYLIDLFIRYLKSNLHVSYLFIKFTPNMHILDYQIFIFAVFLDSCVTIIHIICTYIYSLLIEIGRIVID